ncbi:hypothetical protein BH09ACT12_BH09ACT12_31010 [soil metagenome]
MRRVLLPVIPALVFAISLAGCGADDTTALPPPATPSPTASATASAAGVGAASSPTVRFPEDVTTPVQGGDYVAVVLATGTQDDLQASLASVADYGYSAGVSDVSCLQGVAERLDLPADALVSSLLFADKKTARRFADAYIEAEDGLMVGRAAVKTYCLD